MKNDSMKNATSKKLNLILPLVFSVFVAGQVSASVAAVPKYLSDLVKLVAAHADSSAGTLSRRVRDSNHDVTEVVQFQKQFQAYSSKNAWKPETIVSYEFIPVGQVVVNGKPKVFSAVNFYVPQQTGPFQIALGGVKKEQVESLLLALEDTGLAAFQGARQSASFTAVSMADDSTMQMATFLINRRQLDESDLKQVIRTLRTVVEPTL